MADLQRATFAGNHRLPDVRVAPVSNLLTTTLVAAAIALPLSAGRSLPLQQHHPSKAKQLNADTSRGTPKTLIADSRKAQPLPLQHAPQHPGVRGQLVPQTTAGSPLALRAPVVAAPPIVPVPSLQVARYAWQPGDTSQDAPRFLLVDPLASGVPDFQAPLRYPYGVSDTSWRNVAALDVVQTPVVPSLLVSVQLLRTLDDTSAGTPKALTTDATLPFDGLQQNPPQIGRVLSDTSRSAPQVLLAVVQPPAPPFVPASWLGVDWPRQVQDTSHGVPKTLIADAIAPLDNAQIFQPLAPRNVVDTSAGSPKTLLVIPPLPPVVNPQVWAPDALRPVWDTSRGTPKALTADATQPVVNAQGVQPQAPRHLADTSAGTARALLVVPPAPIAGAAQTWLLQQPRIGSDTSAGMPRVLMGVPAPVVNLPVWTLPAVRPVWDTSRGMPTTLANPPTFVAGIDQVWHVEARDKQWLVTPRARDWHIEDEARDALVTPRVN